MKNPPADDPYDAPDPTRFAPADRAARLNIALQLCVRRVQDLRDLAAAQATARVRKMLYGYIVMEMHEGRQVVNDVTHVVKDGRDLPPHNNDISGFVAARRAYDKAQRVHLPDIGAIRNARSRTLIRARERRSFAATLTF